MNFAPTTSHPARRSAVAVPVARVCPPPQAQSSIGIGISVGFAPPALPVYVQPPIPGDGYIWTPGYWAYGDAGYYWVPGIWVRRPQPAFSGRPATGASTAATTACTPATGAPTSASTAASTTASATAASASAAASGAAAHFAYNSAVANFGGVHVTNVYVDRTSSSTTPSSTPTT